MYQMGYAIRMYIDHTQSPLNLSELLILWSFTEFIVDFDSMKTKVRQGSNVKTEQQMIRHMQLYIANIRIDNPVVSIVTQRQQYIPRRAALNTRNTIRAQLMDMSQG